MTSVVVTGAGRGIGLAIARHLSERGWDVYATAQAVLPKLRAARGRVVFMSSVSGLITLPAPTCGDALDDDDRMTSQLSPAHRELYASHLAGNRKLLGRMQKLAGDPQKVVKAVDRALTSRLPKRRYRCDKVSRAQLALVSATPTAVTDALFAGATTS